MAVSQQASEASGPGGSHETAVEPVADSDALLTGEFSSTPELVIALVTGLGTQVRPVVEDFKAALKTVGYETEHIRVSELIHQLNAEHPGGSQAAETLAEQLMDEGDRLREAVNHGGAACALAMTTIRAQRAKATKAARTERRNGVATLIQSLKHPEEIRLLRIAYGPRLLVVGVSASLEDREEALGTRLREEHPGRRPEWYAAQTTRLLVRDEKDQERPLGQRVREAFSQSDVFVWVQPGRSSTSEIRRIVELIFGKPFETPTRHEQAMFFAHAAQFRSAASGRQVGAAIVDGQGELLATGTNEVPRPGGGQYWTGDDPDHRDFVSGVEANDQQKYMIVQDLLQRLNDAGWFSESTTSKGIEQLTALALDGGGPLRESRVNDLIEFGRIAHAEMAAISTAARRGTPIRGATLYTTTYPCHECARLIIAVGIGEVVYIDPYPKSQVSSMYGSQVDRTGKSPGTADTLPFTPFHGIAPRLFPEVFAMGDRRRDLHGNFASWSPRPRLAKDARAMESMIVLEEAVVSQLVQRLTRAGWLEEEGPTFEPESASNSSSMDVGTE